MKKRNAEAVVLEFRAESVKWNGGSEGAGLFDPHSAAKAIIGEPEGGAGFLYLFRRFGPPRNQPRDMWKTGAAYFLSSPQPGVVLRIEVGKTLQFGFGISDEVKAKIEQEIKQAFRERMERMRRAVEGTPDEPYVFIEGDEAGFEMAVLAWREETNNPDFAQDEAEDTLEMERFETRCGEAVRRAANLPEAGPHPWLEREDGFAEGSCRAQVRDALQATLRDLLRPTVIRDWVFDVRGKADDRTLQREPEVGPAAHEEE